MSATLRLFELEVRGSAMIDEAQFKKDMGLKLRRLRTAVGLKQAELAVSVGLERTSITNIESGKQMVTIPVLYRICHVLGVVVSDVLPSLDEVLRHRIETNQQAHGVEIGGKTMAAINRVRRM